MLNADNDEHRRMFETCITKGSRILNPIIDWTMEDVWEFLNHYGCRSNPLYECGYKRVGCVGCPKAGSQRQKEHFEKYPKIRAAYIRAFDKMLASRNERGLPTTRWQDGEGVMAWWLSDAPSKYDIDERQISLFEEGECLR